jgi:hypothetical protein
MFLDRHPDPAPPAGRWSLPRVDGGGIKVPLSELAEFTTADDKDFRNFGFKRVWNPLNPA